MNPSNEKIINYYSLDNGQTYTKYTGEFNVILSNNNILTFKSESTNGTILDFREKLSLLVSENLNSAFTNFSPENDSYYRIVTKDEKSIIHTFVQTAGLNLQDQRAHLILSDNMNHYIYNDSMNSANFITEEKSTEKFGNIVMITNDNNPPNDFVPKITLINNILTLSGETTDNETSIKKYTYSVKDGNIQIASGILIGSANVTLPRPGLFEVSVTAYDIAENYKTGITYAFYKANSLNAVSETGATYQKYYFNDNKILPLFWFGDNITTGGGWATYTEENNYGVATNLGNRVRFNWYCSTPKRACVSGIVTAQKINAAGFTKMYVLSDN